MKNLLLTLALCLFASIASAQMFPPCTGGPCDPCSGCEIIGRTCVCCPPVASTLDKDPMVKPEYKMAFAYYRDLATLKLTPEVRGQRWQKYLADKKLTMKELGAVALASMKRNGVEEAVYNPK